MSVHDRRKAIVVVALDEMGEFMDDEIFEAPCRLLSQFEIEPDPRRPGIAAAPLSFSSS